MTLSQCGSTCPSPGRVSVPGPLPTSPGPSGSLDDIHKSIRLPIEAVDPLLDRVGAPIQDMAKDVVLDVVFGGGGPVRALSPVGLV